MANLRALLVQLKADADALVEGTRHIEDMSAPRGSDWGNSAIHHLATELLANYAKTAAAYDEAMKG